MPIKKKRKKNKMANKNNHWRMVWIESYKEIKRLRETPVNKGWFRAVEAFDHALLTLRNQAKRVAKERSENAA